MARVLVTGVSGQIGSFLAEILVIEGHRVLGAGRPGSAKSLPVGVEPARGAWSEAGLSALLNDNGPLDSIVHLGGETNILVSWRDPVVTFDVNARLVAHAVYTLALGGSKVRFVCAGSSNMFGRAATPVLDEHTPIAPVSPYGVSKAAAYLAVKNTREGLGAPHSNLVFFVGLSSRSAPGNVLRLITEGVARVRRGEASHVSLGTLGVVRDVCHARDFAEAAKLLALGARAGDYVCASGTGRSVREMAAVACRLAGLDARATVREDPNYERPNDIPTLVGNPSRLRALGWSPQVGFEELVRELLDDAMRGR